MWSVEYGLDTTEHKNIYDIKIFTQQHDAPPRDPDTAAAGPGGDQCRPRLPSAHQASGGGAVQELGENAARDLLQVCCNAK